MPTSEGRSEILLAPDMDLAGLQACASRMAQAVRLLTAMERLGGSCQVNGVAPFRTLDAIPDLPLASTTTAVPMSVGGMEAKASISLTPLAGEGWAAITIDIECLPMLGRTSFVEWIRTDRSNMPSPTDAIGVAAVTTRNLHRLVTDKLAEYSRDMAAGRTVDPWSGIQDENAAIGDRIALAAFHDASEDLGDERPQVHVRSSAPYGPAAIETVSGAHGGSLTTSRPTAAAIAAVSALVPPQCLLTETRKGITIEYAFGPSTFIADAPVVDEDDAMAVLRSLEPLKGLDGPFWDTGRVV